MASASVKPLRPLRVPAGPAGAAMVLEALADETRAAALLTPMTPNRPWPETAEADLVLLSSGSSGVSKAVRHTHASVRWSARTSIEVLGADEWTWLLVLSPASAGGVATLARGLLTGRPPAVWPGVGGALPFAADAVTEWAGELDRWAGSVPRRAASAVTTQVARLLAVDAGVRLLAGLEAVLVGGGPFPAALAERCAGHGINAIPTYGSTETFGGCVYAGRPWPGVIVTAPSGRLHVAGPMVSPGYLDGPDIRQPFDTGDLGEVSDGVVRVSGRADGVVPVRGVNVSLAEVEAEALTTPGVVDAVAVAVEDDADGYRIVTFVEDADHRLPRLPTGKPDRQALARRARGDGDAVD